MSEVVKLRALRNMPFKGGMKEELCSVFFLLFFFLFKVATEVGA